MKIPKDPIMLTSSSPVASDGNEYNFLYIAGVIGGIIGLINGGFGGLLLIGTVGFACAYAIKSLILDTKNGQLYYRLKFTLPEKVPVEYLTGELVKRLMPMGITVEADFAGYPVITHNKIKFDISYNDDNTFTIMWSKTWAKTFLPSNNIKLYRKLVVSYGIIAYHIQQISLEYKEKKEFNKYWNM